MTSHETRNRLEDLAGNRLAQIDTWTLQSDAQPDTSLYEPHITSICLGGATRLCLNKMGQYGGQLKAYSSGGCSWELEFTREPANYHTESETSTLHDGVDCNLATCI